MKDNLLKKIQEKVKLQSVNSLGNLYPDDIIEWLEDSEMEAKEIIDFLHDNRILTYKYRVNCCCSERFIIYENQLNQDRILHCPICGRTFSLWDIKENAEIIYKISKEELLNLENRKVEFMEFPILKSKVISIREKLEERKTMEIFIGSSSEAKDYMDEIAVKLEELNVIPLLWNASGKGIFIPGRSTIDALLDITKRVNAAIFIFNAQDKVWNKKSALKTSDAVRDNVLFEYGLFAGALGKENVCFVCKGNPQLASDLEGITYIDGDWGDAAVKLKIKDWINSLC